MKTALVLTDFSESANYAARYAATIAKSLGIDDIVLFHAAQIITQTAATQIIVLEGLDRIEEAEQYLDELRNELKQIDGSLNYRTKYAEAHITHVIDDLIDEYRPQIVFIGLSGKSGAERFLIGSNTLKLINTCRVPLMVVPQNDFEKPTEIIYATDLKDVAKYSPIKLIKELISQLGTSFHIVNVGGNRLSIEKSDFDEIGDLHELFDNEQAEYHYLDHSRTVEGLLTFSQNYPNAIILTVAKEHGFFSKLIKGSITEKLASLSKNPLLIVKNNSY